MSLSASTVPQRGRGDGLEKRLVEAAERGDAVSQCNLGILYANGLDDNGYAVKGNRPQAVRWLLAAAVMTGWTTETVAASARRRARG